MRRRHPSTIPIRSVQQHWSPVSSLWTRVVREILKKARVTAPSARGKVRSAGVGSSHLGSPQGRISRTRSKGSRIPHFRVTCINNATAIRIRQCYRNNPPVLDLQGIHIKRDIRTRIRPSSFKQPKRSRRLFCMMPGISQGRQTDPLG